MAKGTKYTPEFKAKAVRLLTESRGSYSSETKAVEQVARDLGGVFLCFCQLLGELTCRDSGWLSWARFALPVASGVLSRVARFRLRGLVPGRGFRF